MLLGELATGISVTSPFASDTLAWFCSFDAAFRSSSSTDFFLLFGIEGLDDDEE